MLTPLDTYDKCFNRNGSSNPSYSAANYNSQPIIRAPAASGGFNLNVVNKYANQGGIKTEGVDLAVNWNFPAGPGLMSFVLQSSYLMKFERSLLKGEEFLEYAGFGNNFDVRSLLTAGYAWDSIDIGLRWKYLSESESLTCVDSAVCSPAADAYNLFDFFSNYHVSDAVQLNFGIDNLLDEDPVVVDSTLGQTSGEYGIVGRTYYVGIKANF